MFEIDLRQILITNPIIDSVKKYNYKINYEYKLSVKEQGFNLNRLDSLILINFDSLIKNSPIKIKKATYNNKNIGIKIDGIVKQAYEIIDGRHRIALAILNNKKKINSIII